MVNDFFVADRFFWSTAFTVQPSTKQKIVPIFLLVATYNVQDYVLGPQIIVKREGKRPSKNELRRMSVLCTYMTQELTKRADVNFYGFVQDLGRMYYNCLLDQRFNSFDTIEVHVSLDVTVWCRIQVNCTGSKFTTQLRHVLQSQRTHVHRLTHPLQRLIFSKS